jgi:hypothetical protein
MEPSVTTADKERLENMINKYDLAAVIDTLASICTKKANNICSATSSLAHEWMHASKMLSALADTLKK